MIRIGRWQFSLEGLALVAVLLALWHYTGQCAPSRADATADARAAAVLDSLRAEAERVDTVYRTDTVRLWRVKERWDTAYVDVERWKHDTVEVVRYVALADSTIRACTAALRTCEQRVADRDAQLRAWESRWANRPQPPSKLVQTARDALWLAAGVGVGAVLTRR